MVVNELAKVLSPLTRKLEAFKLLFTILGFSPFMTKLETCSALCRSSVAPEIVNEFETLPKPADPIVKVPDSSVVLPVNVFEPLNMTCPVLNPEFTLRD